MLAYDESLAEMLQSVCILDVVQENQTGISWRMIEALYYNKKLLTNNKKVLVSDYYDPRYIQYFERAEDINTDWIVDEVNVDFRYRNDYSPLVFLDQVMREMGF